MSALTQNLIDEITAAPEPVQREVLNFLLFLKSRQTDERDTLPQLAQTAWAADWDTPAEDAARRDL